MAGLSAGGAHAAPDHEVWLYASVQGRLAGEWTDEFQVLEKRNDDAHKPYAYEAEAIFGHALGGPWSTTVGLAEIRQVSGVAWLNENRPFASLAFHEVEAGWGLGVRGQVEFRNREAQSDMWRYRLRTIISLPMPRGSTWSPFVSYEGYYEHVRMTDRWDQTRLFFGTAHTWSKSWSGEVFAGWKEDYASSGWRQTLPLGLKLTRHF